MAIPEKARVAALTGIEKIEVFELPVPQINDDEVLIKVEGCGICGTDVHEYRRDPFKFIPIQLGHEGSGEIVAIGKNVTMDYTGKPLKVGDKVVTGLKTCGTCDVCKNDPEHVELCPNGEIFGLLPGEENYFHGYYGDYMVIGKGGVIFNVSDMPDLDLRLLIEPTAVGVHAVEMAKKIFNFKHNSYVGISGCGPIGLLVIVVLRTMGVRNIIGIDNNPARLDMAKKLGAAYTINFMDEDRYEQMQKITGKDGADFVFQCTGVPKAAEMVWKYIRRGGGLCEMGFFLDGGPAQYNPHFDMCNKEIMAVGSWTYKACDWVHAIEILKEAAERNIPVTELVSDKYPLDQMNEAMAKNISMTGFKIAFVNDR